MVQRLLYILSLLLFPLMIVRPAIFFYLVFNENLRLKEYFGRESWLVSFSCRIFDLFMRESDLDLDRITYLKSCCSEEGWSCKD